MTDTGAHTRYRAMAAGPDGGAAMGVITRVRSNCIDQVVMKAIWDLRLSLSELYQLYKLTTL